MSIKERKEIDDFLFKSLPYDLLSILPYEQKQELIRNSLLNTFEGFLIELNGKWNIDAKDLVEVIKTKLLRHSNSYDITLGQFLDVALTEHEKKFPHNK